MRDKYTNVRSCDIGEDFINVIKSVTNSNRRLAHNRQQQNVVYMLKIVTNTKVVHT